MRDHDSCLELTRTSENFLELMRDNDSCLEQMRANEHCLELIRDNNSCLEPVRAKDSCLEQMTAKDISQQLSKVNGRWFKLMTANNSIPMTAFYS